MTEAERIGLLKIDFLGLRNLSIIHQILTQVKKDLGINIDIEKIPSDDQKCLNCCRKEIRLAYSN